MLKTFDSTIIEIEFKGEKHQFSFSLMYNKEEFPYILKNVDATKLKGFQWHCQLNVSIMTPSLIHEHVISFMINSFIRISIRSKEKIFSFLMGGSFSELSNKIFEFYHKAYQDFQEMEITHVCQEIKMDNFLSPGETLQKD